MSLLSCASVPAKIRKMDSANRVTVSFSEESGSSSFLSIANAAPEPSGGTDSKREFGSRVTISLAIACSRRKWPTAHGVGGGANKVHENCLGPIERDRGRF